ncbi:unnamed protein product [Tilletia laevis]|nr:unnamed protein product [Tilletia laevis]
MCGILGCLHHPDAAAYRPLMLQLSRCIRHHGPDWSGYIVTEEGGSKGSILCHERLAIVGVDTGAQPLTSTFSDGKDTSVSPSWWKTDSTDAAVTESGGKPDPTPSHPVDFKLLRETLELAVRTRLMSEVPYGVLLSGGLDSSFIAAIAARETERMAESQSKAVDALRAKRQKGGAVSPSGTKPTYVHLCRRRSPDLVAARREAEYLGAVHHDFTSTPSLFKKVSTRFRMSSTTWRPTTIKIKAIGVKMVLSGEGSDEILGGYPYFHATLPSDSHTATA